MKKKITLFALALIPLFTLAQTANTLLWRITNPANKKSSYLFGTIHIPQERFMQLTDSVYYAINNTNWFYGELDPDKLLDEMSDTAFMMSKVRYLDSIKVTPQWRKLIENINSAYNATIDPENFDDFIAFSQKQLIRFMKPDPGVEVLDLALSKYAKQLDKRIGAFETFIFQLDMMYKIIDVRVKNPDMLFTDDIILSRDLQRMYATVQIDSMTKLLSQMHPQYRSIIFDDRNKSMTDSIEKITSTTTAFFAVGCGHLFGETGIINLLQKKGLQVSPVFSQNHMSITFVNGILTKATTTAIKKEKEDEMPPDLEKLEDVKIDMTMPPPPAPPKNVQIKPVTKKAKTKKG